MASFYDNLRFVKDEQGNRVPARYIQTRNWYSDNDRKRTRDTYDFIQNMRNTVDRSKVKQYGDQKITISDIDGLSPKLKYATEKQEEALAKEIQGRMSKPFFSNASIHTEYVPVVFREDNDSSTRTRTGYLIRSGRPQERDTIYGMVLDDGTNLTSNGAKNFIENIISNNGGMALGSEDGGLSYDLSKYVNPNGNKWRVNSRGFTEALQATGINGTKNLSANGGVGALPANWWGL